MAVHPIVIVGDPVLHRPCTKVAEFDEKLRELVADMYETNTAANGVGLAANQIGVDLALFIYDCPDYDAEDFDPQGPRRRGVVVNPVLETSEIPESMPDPDDDWEGCLSVPGESYPTGRATWSKVTGFDADGAPIEVEGTGYLARCFQHETDHVNGVIYLDRLVGRHRRDVKRMLKRNDWGEPGNSWNPGEVPDPFGH